MDANAAMIIAAIDRMAAWTEHDETCSSACTGWCRRPPLALFTQAANKHEKTVVLSVEPPPPASTSIGMPTCIDAYTTDIPVVIYSPEQLFVGGDPAKGFVKPTTGTRGTTTWEGLVRLLSRAPEGDAKKHSDPNIAKAARGGWSACALRGGRRLASAFEETRLLGLDIDKNGDVEKALKAFEPFKKIVHITYKSTPDKPRCRVILLLKQPCRETEVFRRAHRAVRHAVVRAGWFHEDDFDDAGSDPSRLWYLPMVPPGVPYTFHATDGALLDVGKLATSAATKKPCVKKTAKTGRPNTDGSGALAWADRKMREAPEGHRHKTVYSTAVWLSEIEPPIPEHEIESVLLRHAPDGHENEFKRTIADAIRRGRAA